uniref:AWS domain-containing protein n=1 Tax=Aegilops tauschii subsp. strangulata TaxID=200361 RepID=A0A453SV06_AEGTS
PPRLLLCPSLRLAAALTSLLCRSPVPSAAPAQPPAGRRHHFTGFCPGAPARARRRPPAYLSTSLLPPPLSYCRRPPISFYHRQQAHQAPDLGHDFVDFDLPSALKEWKLGYYIPIKRNIYLTKKRVEDDGIFCSCSLSSESSVTCGKDCQCGMLFSCCSSNCKCENKCANKSFQLRPLFKTELIKVRPIQVLIISEFGRTGHLRGKVRRNTAIAIYGAMM